MNFITEINNLRRSAMRRLTKNVGTAHADQHIGSSDQSEIKKILICRPNHRLGNLLLMTPLLQEIQETLPQAKVDLFVKGDLSPLVFKNYENVNGIIQLPKKPFKEFFKYLQVWFRIKNGRYDIAFNVIEESSSGRISAQLSNAKYKFFGNKDGNFSHQSADYAHLAKSPVYNFRFYLKKSGFAQSEKPVAPLNLKLSLAEIAEGKTLLRKIVGNDEKTICLFTNATGDKIYATEWWEAFYGKLIIAYPDYNIIEVLPVENTSQIGFKAPTYSNKDIRVIGSFIANTAVFIAADSGMMHLAAATQVPTVGLFKVTDPKAYEPYGNKSVAIDTNTGDIDDYMKVVKDVLFA